jgi:hypothetical protein
MRNFMPYTQKLREKDFLYQFVKKIFNSSIEKDKKV